VCVAGPAQADVITGLFDTGLGAGAVDPNYVLLSAPAGVTTGPTILNSIPAAWFDPTSVAANWIGVNDDDAFNFTPPNGNTDPAGLYVYRLTFSLAGLNPSSALITGRLAVDNSATIFLNGIDMGLISQDSGVLGGFSLASGFVSGQNQLDFHVTNFPQEFGNPTGLIVSGLSGTADPTNPANVPEPTTIALVAIGLAFCRRRRSTAS